MGRRRKVITPGAPGGPIPCQLEECCRFDTCDILDQRESEWVRGYETRFRRNRVILFVDNVTLDNVTTSYTSKSFFCQPYQLFSLLCDLAAANTPTDLLIEVEFSDDDTNFYKLMNGPFGDLRWEDTALPVKEEIQWAIRAAYVRIKITGTGTTAVNTFTATIKMSLNS